jgi:nucleoside-diphosphate-sugar epimerase
VYIDNLIELIFTVARQKASGIFLPADEYPLSTDMLLSLMQKNLNNKTSLINMPSGLRYALKILKPDLYNRLFNSLVVNNTQTNKALSFKPLYSSNEGITKMVAWFKLSNKL